MKKERGQVGGQRASVAPIIHGLSCKTARVYGRAKNIIIILSITGQAGFQRRNYRVSGPTCNIGIAS